MGVSIQFEPPYNVKSNETYCTNIAKMKYMRDGIYGKGGINCMHIPYAYNLCQGENLGWHKLYAMGASIQFEPPHNVKSNKPYCTNIAKIKYMRGGIYGKGGTNCMHTPYAYNLCQSKNLWWHKPYAMRVNIQFEPLHNVTSNEPYCTNVARMYKLYA